MQLKRSPIVWLVSLFYLILWLQINNKLLSKSVWSLWKGSVVVCYFLYSCLLQFVCLDLKEYFYEVYLTYLYIGTQFKNKNFLQRCLKNIKTLQWYPCATFMLIFNEINLRTILMVPNAMVCYLLKYHMWYAILITCAYNKFSEM